MKTYLKGRKEKDKMYFKLLQIIMNSVHIWTWKL